MLGRSCDKIITPTTNQWPQNQIVLDDHKSVMASSSSTNKAMAAAASEKPNQPDPHPLNCPRCNSSNTKFCYYNNYSLSQPRHFCKACKRYWTRGGTLRNVPVGGGCRKNKRPKRHSSDSISSSSSSAAAPSLQPQMTSSAHVQSPLFYGLPTNSLELNFPFSNFRVSSDAAGFDLHPQINGLGLGFSSGLMSNEASNNGFKPIQDAITSSTSSPFSANSANNSSIFFGSSSFSTSSTMASLLASTLQQQQQKSVTIPSLILPYEDPQMPGKQVKAEGENRLGWNPTNNPSPNPNPNPIDQINSSDPSSLLWNTTSIGAWFDPSTMGSSVPSLI